jgi:co-chaperonin GroES (HSP10)
MIKSLQTLLKEKGEVLSAEEAMEVFDSYLSQQGIPVPNGNLVLVKPIKVDKTESGLLLPDDYADNKKFGLVMSAGELVRPSIHSGVKVLWLKNPGERCTYDGEEYIFMRDVDIQATVKSGMQVVESYEREIEKM